MAQRVQISLTDDLLNDDTLADETLSFAIDGTSYEIDLSTARGYLLDLARSDAALSEFAS